MTAMPACMTGLAPQSQRPQREHLSSGAWAATFTNTPEIDQPIALQAAAARQAQLAAAAARMAEQGAQAKARSRLVRASKQARLQAKAAALQQRQERASQARHEMVQAFVHSLPHAGGGSWQLRSGEELAAVLSGRET